MKTINIKKLIKWLLFFGAFPFSYFYLALFILFPPFFLVGIVWEIFAKYLPVVDSDPLIVLFFVLPVYFSFLVMYVYAKIFGFFKFIDSLNMKFVLRVGVVTVVALVLSVISYLSSFSKNDLLRANEDYLFCAFALIPAYFLYKFFQFLTKKYPVPFEKIGYYSSKEFYKKLVKNIYSKLKSKFVKN